jgi:hypothetical protein
MRLAKGLGIAGMVNSSLRMVKAFLTGAAGLPCDCHRMDIFIHRPAGG